MAQIEERIQNDYINSTRFDLREYIASHICLSSSNKLLKRFRILFSSPFYKNNIHSNDENRTEKLNK